MKAVYVPRFLFTGAHVDLIEWDGTSYTVTVELTSSREEELFQKEVTIIYCDGVRHIVALEYLLEKLKAYTHSFSWYQHFSAGGGQTHNIPYNHVRGCSCSN